MEKGPYQQYLRNNDFITWHVGCVRDIYIYIYVCVCVCVCVCACVCVCVWFGSNLSFKHVWLDNKDTFCLYILIKIISNILISVLVSDWNWWMNLPKSLRTISVNSSINSNLKPRHLSGNLKGSQSNYIDKMCESKYGSKSDCVKKAGKHNPNRWIYYDVKSTLNVSVSVTIIGAWISE